jgi:RNA polymerase sigma-70 factor, ECF subfamily
MVMATAQRILGSPDDAEDVLQDVFLKLLRDEASLLSPRQWGAYLRVMASHAAIDRLRKRKSHLVEGLDSVMEFADESKPSARAQLEHQRLAGQLRHAIAQLPQREAQVFALRHLEEFSYDEIARELEMSVSNVGVLLHRARLHLRELLSPLAMATVGGKDVNE